MFYNLVQFFPYRHNAPNNCRAIFLSAVDQMHSDIIYTRHWQHNYDPDGFWLLSWIGPAGTNRVSTESGPRCGASNLVRGVAFASIERENLVRLNLWTQIKPSPRSIHLVEGQVPAEFAGELHHPLHGHLRGVVEVVHDDGLESAEEELQHRVAPDVARSPRHEHPHRHRRHRRPEAPLRPTESHNSPSPSCATASSTSTKHE